jgi:hypothetical protein
MKQQPTLRKPLGVLAILGLIAFWAYLLGSLSSIVAQWHILAQGIFYLIAGIVWIAPLGPLLRWMETGQFRKPRQD